MFNDLDVDLLVTGELSHHEALAAIEKGKCVVALLHSNSERGYLHVMRPKLLEVLREEWARIREQEGAESSGEAEVESSCRVDVSERDRDPYGFAVLKE